MFKILIIALDELKQRLRTEWAKLDHVVIAASVLHLLALVTV